MRRFALLLVFLLAAPAASGELRFEPAGERWGIDFRHRPCGSGEFYMVESVGSGVAVLDYDSDGDPDVLYVDGGFLPGCEGPRPRTRLYRNDGGGRFEDVTDRSRIVLSAFGMGVTAGDVDSDGDLDVYFSSFGRNQLFLNQGDGTFVDTTEASGTGDDHFGASAAFGDGDQDGDLDLYVTNYVDFALDNNIVCGPKKYGRRSYCHPDVYNGVADHYYENRGDGTFADVTQKAGFGGAHGKGLGVAWSDLDGDFDQDLYVANDMTFNFQYENRGDGTFEDVAVLVGTAASDVGSEEASMGIAIGDFDQNGRIDLFLTHIDFQSNAVYSNVGEGIFLDQRYVAGVAEPSIKKVGFGTSFGDFDQDGDLDLVVANGHIIPGIEDRGTGTSYRQLNQLFENVGEGRLMEVVSPGFEVERVSRGLALGDLDLDGDLDVVINNLDDEAEVYENVSRGQGGWLKLDLDRPAGNRHAIGAWVEITSGGRRQVAEVRTAASYLSQSETTLHFGLGAAPSVDELRVRFPDGKKVKVRGLPRDRRVRLAVP